MRTYTEAETCMMLLFAPLGEEAAPGRTLFQDLRQMLLASGQAEGEEVTEEELLRLGLGPEAARDILTRLDREDALDAHLRWLRRQGITLITRISPEYPGILRQRLGEGAPKLLYCAGNLSLLKTRGIALVGARDLREPGRGFARAVGKAVAAEGLTLISGGAQGADTEGFLGCYENGGNSVLFVADSLLTRKDEMARELASGRLLLVSEYGPDQHFSLLRAHSRNRLIHGLGEKAFVAQSACGSGGTWTGTMENLKQGWCPVFVCTEEADDPGTVGLLERGGAGLKTHEVKNLSALDDVQIRLF